MINILLIGGTGVIGKSLTEELLLSKNFSVFITTRNTNLSSSSEITYIYGDSLDEFFIKNIIDSHDFDVIVDFMVYPTSLFSKLVSYFLNNCMHYIFLSSYRVYSDSGNKKLTEESLRLIDDTTINYNYRKSEEYAIKKAKQENILFEKNMKNWTILRPSITFGKNRIQLFCFECSFYLPRIMNDLPIVIPKYIKDIKTTYTDSNFSAKYILNIINNKNHFTQVFNLCSDFNTTWGNIFDFFSKELDAKFIEVDFEQFKSLHVNLYQVKFDRMLNRNLSNSKLLSHVVVKNSLPTCSFFDKLRKSLKESNEFKFSGRINGRMDNIIGVNNRKLVKTKIARLKYDIGHVEILNSIYGHFSRNKFLKR